MDDRARAIFRNGWKDPLGLARFLWPKVSFYTEQVKIIESIRDNKQTFVSAGNKLGKDFTAGFVVLWYFLTRTPCRIVTTSAKEDHLRVLWSEIARYLQTASVPLLTTQGGPLLVNHQNIRKQLYDASGQPLNRCPISYAIGMVASSDSIAAMQGHHVAANGDGIPRTLFVSDESSSVQDEYFKMAITWADRLFVFGNPWPCQNFFYTGVTDGDMVYPQGSPSSLPRVVGSKTVSPLFRKVVKIRAQDSPNVRRGLFEADHGMRITNKIIVPGVKSYAEYLENRATWDKVQQCVSLDAEFYKGAEAFLVPQAWLDRAARLLRDRDRVAKAMGVDPAEGGDKTSITIVDELGVLFQANLLTPDTTAVVDQVLKLMDRFKVPARKVLFDRGGGGKQHADRLRRMGHMVKSVGFGESPTIEPKSAKTLVTERKEIREEHYVYKNLRAQMYGETSLLLDPGYYTNGWAIPVEYAELRRQLSVMPKWYDEEGRLYLPPKQRKPTDKGTLEKVTINQLVGHSPDEADSCVLAVHAMLDKGTKPKVSVAVAPEYLGEKKY